MRYAIIADIHANLEGFQRVLADIKEQKCTHVVCLGDVVGYGANPKECLDIVRGMNIPTVKGNHDEYIGLDEDPEGFNDAAAEAVMTAGAIIIGGAAERLPNTLFMAVEGWDSPQQLITLDLQGVMVSAGSACSSGKTKPSKTIMAMGLEHLATGGVRVSGGWGTTCEDWERFASAWVEAYAKHRARTAERQKADA